MARRARGRGGRLGTGGESGHPSPALAAGLVALALLPAPAAGLLDHNYTAEVMPSSFQAGQEVRVMLQTTANGSAANAFDMTAEASLEVRMYRRTAAHVEDCASYAASADAPLHTRTEFGVDNAAVDAGSTSVSTAHATFTATDAEVEVVFCYYHTLNASEYEPGVGNAWTLVRSASTSTATYRAAASSLWYEIVDPTEQQYAVMRILSMEGFDLTYAASVAITDLSAYAGGDNLKIVPAGAPCTYEYQALTKYLGSAFVGASGVWAAAAEAGLTEGAVAGGVGAFGTQFANPLVETWANAGVYSEIHANGTSVDVPTGYTQHAYVYVKLGDAGSRYDVCYSAKAQRAALISGNNGVFESLPMWRKLYRCTDAAACAAGAGNAASLTFDVAAEEVGWTAYDLTPETWGELVFDDSGTNGLSNLAALSHTTGLSQSATPDYPEPVSPAANYYAPQGGDYFRLVPESVFDEASRMTAARLVNHTSAVMGGSFPGAGCWRETIQPDADGIGGVYESGAVRPIASFDLGGDPTSLIPVDNANTSVGLTSSTVYLAKRDTRWRVCYRRTCNLAGSRCAARSGMRVLDFHSSGVGNVAPKFLHLEDRYTPAGTKAFIPGDYVNVNTTTPQLSWYADDTRVDTYGPVVIERVNGTAGAMLDTRPWNFRRNYGGAAATVAGTSGSALRLVPQSRGCHYPEFGDRLGIDEAHAADGGLVECSSADAGVAGTGCDGSAADFDAVESAAYYITYPSTATDYRVCYRLQGFNWVEVSPWQSSNGPVVDPVHPMPSSVRERAGWTPPANFTTTSWDQAALGVVYTETRAGMEAAFMLNGTTFTLAPREACAGGCARTGAVVRLAPHGTGCDIHPGNYDSAMIDTYLSAACPVVGAGTPAASGLLAAAGTACAVAAPTITLCGGVGCTDTQRAFLRYIAVTPHPYDDFIPFEEPILVPPAGVAVATLPLPAHQAADAALNRYDLCLKQVATSNWVILDDALAVQPAPSLLLDRPLRREVLTGEYTEFAIKALLGTSDEYFPVTDGGNGTVTAHFVFTAKLVPWGGDGWGAGAGSSCSNPPGHTESEPFGAATTEFTFAMDESDGRMLVFSITAPHAPGDYALCVNINRGRAGDELSWWRMDSPTGAQISVVESGIRWHVEAGNEPTNLGLSRVTLSRCPPGLAACSFAEKQPDFETSPGADAAKIVPVAQPCVEDASLSTHVGIGAPAAGVTDLGPRDGTTETATLKITLPAHAQDLPQAFKVCVKAYHALPGANLDERVWVEVAQDRRGLAGQAFVTDADGRSAFYTRSAELAGWVLDAGITPKANLFSSAVAAASGVVVGLAGASTVFNGNAAGGVAPQYGLSIQPLAGVSDVMKDAEFKLVLSRRPDGNYPEYPTAESEARWAETENWTDLDVDCFTEGSPDASSHGAGCTDASTSQRPSTCPNTVDVAAGSAALPLQLHLPLDTGRYLVCVRYGGRPWQLLPPVGSGGADIDFGLYTHPSYLEFDEKGQQSNVTVYDLRMTYVNNSLVPWASWCGADGTTCTAFTRDLLTVVNDLQVCPLPAQAPSGNGDGGPPQWYQLHAPPGSTGAGVATTWLDAAKAFALPPATDPSASSEYKVCVYKSSAIAADASTGVSRGGVVYQLRNRGERAAGGGSGYFRGEVTFRVKIDHNLDFDAAKRFVEYDTTTEETYSGVNTEELTVAESAQMSRTPLVDTSDSVGWRVSLVGADTGGQVQGVAFSVTVMRCPTPRSWAELDCPTTDLIAPTAAHGNIDTFALEQISSVFPQCRKSMAAKYDRDPTGLEQPSVAGAAAYDLQYKSACPSSEFGCGVRFQVTLSDGTILYSAPQWVNVRHRPVDSVLINNEIVFPFMVQTVGSVEGCAATNSPRCYVRTCRHGEPCTMTFDARYQGAPNHAPLGNSTLLFSERDYVGTYYPWAVPSNVVEVFLKTVADEPMPIMPESPWAYGGRVEYTFTPVLQGDHQQGLVFLNFTFGDRVWVRNAVRVVKPQPARFNVKDITPLDIDLGLTAGRTPAPVVNPEPDTAAIPEGIDFKAQAGSYLEALIPYQIIYEPVDQEGIPLLGVPGTMNGWGVRAYVAGSFESKILSVITTDPRLNMVTEPRTLEGAAFDRILTRGDVNFTMTFRVYVADSACSRFNAKGGCDVTFQFSLKGVVLQATVRTPVRIPASTVDVDVAASPTPITPRIGAVVSVYPGTWVRTPADLEVFVIDEFHYGEAFALIASPSPTDGTVSRDGFLITNDEAPEAMLTGCAYPSGACVGQYAMRELAGRKWGASWRMRSNMPCQDCGLTFHTTGGAGPESWALDADTGLPRGVLRQTWQPENVVLRCENIDVDYPSEASFSNQFDLRVWAGVRGAVDDLSAEYPRYWVYFDRTKDLIHTAGATQRKYLLFRSGENLDVLSTRMGDRAQAVINGMYFGPTPPDFGVVEEFTANITATGPEYRASSGEVGSRPTGTDVKFCTSTIRVNRIEGAGTAESTEIRLVNIDNARPLCDDVDHPEDCDRWVTTTDELGEAGIRVTASFIQVSKTGVITVDESPRNVTIVPDGGVSTVPLGVAPAWTWDLAVGAYVSADVLLDSLYNLPNYWFLGGSSYSYGSLSVKAMRYPPEGGDRLNLVQGGVGSVVLKYGKTGVDPARVDRTPARHTRFRICDSKFHQGVEQTGYLCKTISLWVVSPAEGPSSLPPRTAVITEPHAVQTQGVSAACGGSINQVEVVTYITTSSDPLALRYFVYDAQIEYTISVANQFISQVGSKVAFPAISQLNALSPNVSLDNTLAYESLLVMFHFTGELALGTPTPVKVEAVATLTGTAAVPTQSTTLVRWYAQNTIASTFQLSDEVAFDMECPSKRYMQSITHHYTSYRQAAPGAGWRYADARGAPSAGTPFPLEAAVLDERGGRVWGYPDTLVKVTPLQAEGCGNGGSLALYELNPSNRDAEYVHIEGSLEASFSPLTAGQVTKGGVATIWAVYEKPCEACRLQVDLCYPGEAAAECLSTTSLLDEAPFLADRTKVTKPFTVRQPEVHHVVVKAQALPGGATHHADLGVTEVALGSPLRLTLEDVEAFGGGDGWAMTVKSLHGWTRDVRIHTLFSPDPAQPKRMRYGNGGLLVDVASAADAGRFGGDILQAAGTCLEKTADDVRFDSRVTRLVVDDETYDAHFFFARPCSACEVMVEYVLSPPAGSTAAASSGVFALREYSVRGRAAGGAMPESVVVGDTLRFFARVCAAGSMLWSGRPPVAVRKRTEFSLTLQVADEQGFPNYNPVDRPGLRLSIVPPADDQGMGGGHPGSPKSLIIASPTEAGQAVLSEGSATVRAQLTRACLSCRLKFGDAEHTLSVLTEPSRIIVIPTTPMRTQLYTRYGDVGRWVFDVFAADELGDRSYLVAGPTPHVMHPLYATRFASGGHREGVALSVGSVVPDDLPEVLNARSSDPAKDVQRFTKGGPIARLPKGNIMYNGIPAPYVNAAEDTIVGEIGTATVELTSPGVDYPLRFEAAGFRGLSTSLLGGRRPPTLDFSVLPTRMGVDDPGKVSVPGRCQAYWMTQANPECTFSAYLMGKVPAEGVWALSVAEYGDNITATVDCGTCATAVVEPPVNHFKRGTAEFTLRLTSVSAASGGSACSCDITVTPPAELAREYNATAQYLSIPFTAKQVERWQFTSTSTASVVDAPVIDGFDGEPSTAETVFNRSVALGITGYDATGRYDAIGGVSWWDGYQIEFRQGLLQPPNCFQCIGQVSKTIDGVLTSVCPVRPRDGRNDSVYIEGYVPRDATCRIPKGAVSGLPLGGGGQANALHRDLIITAREPAAIEVVPQALGDMFSGLYRRTYEQRHPAAICGVGAMLTLSIRDAAGHAVVGDSTATARIVGERKVNVTDGGEGATVTYTRWSAPQATARAEGGRIEIHLDTNETTREGACDALRTLPEMVERGCAHAAWYFNVTITAPVINEMGFRVVKTLSVLENIGPLYFVRAAADLRAFGGVSRRDLIDGSITTPLHRDPPAKWLYDTPFNMTIKAVDVHGEVVRHPEDLGSAEEAVFAPMHIPCINIDRTAGGRWLDSTCTALQDGGQCTPLAPVPACSVRESTSWRIPGPPRLLLTRGELLLRNVHYHKAPGAPKAVTTHWQLSTTDAADMWADATRHAMNPANPRGQVDRAHLFQMRIVEPYGLYFRGEGVECRVDTLGINRCTFPTSRTYYTYERFMLNASVVDVDGDSIAVDTTTRVLVTGRCLDVPAKTVFLGRRLPGGELDVLTELRQAVVYGETSFADLEITGACSQFEVRAAAAGLREVRAVFPVSFWPATDLGPGTDTLAVEGLSLDVFTSCAEANSFIDTISRADFEQRMTGAFDSLGFVRDVALHRVCCVDNAEGYTVDPDTCSTREVTPVPPATPTPTNDTAAEDAKTRDSAVLDSKQVVADFYVNAHIRLGYAVYERAVRDTLAAQLNNPSSTLRAAAPGQASIFENADADSMRVLTGAPPPTPPQITTSVPTTPLPPTPEPSTAIPVTATPVVIVPSNITAIPGFTGGNNTLPEAGGVVAPAAWLSPLATLLCTLLLIW